MAFTNDGGGIAFKCNDVKLSGGSSASTWATRIAIHSRKGAIRILTYSLPNLPYVAKILGKRPTDIWIIAHAKFEAQAWGIKSAYPDIRVALNEEIHSKVILIEPRTIWLSSANFGSSGWHESTIGLHSKQAHDWYVDSQFNPLWLASSEVIV